MFSLDLFRVKRVDGVVFRIALKSEDCGFQIDLSVLFPKMPSGRMLRIKAQFPISLVPRNV